MSDQQFHRKAAGGGATDYFALFELPARFRIDRDELDSRYLALSRQTHPDRFVNAPARERVAALQQSMQVNEGYRTLKAPVARAEYLLARAGVTIGDNEQLDPAFLMEILEQREELAEAKATGDRAGLRRLERAMEDRHDAELDDVAALFEKREASGDDSLLADIKKKIIVLRYLRRYLEELEDDDEGEL